MASRRAFGRTSLSSFLIGFWALALICLVSVASASNPPAPPSPSAEVDLICHTDNAFECYPRVFEPTEEFQIVHDDQELPSGLHVRLNIYTGLKEAKINVPGEENPALEGLPVDRAVVLVDKEEAPEPQVPRGAPEYEPVGIVKKPPQESGQFYSDLKYIKKGPDGGDLPFDEALENLEEISHDIYYGLKIVEDFDTLKSLFCIMLDRNSTSVPEGATPRAQQAASILASSLQNNPTALQEVTKAWPVLMEAKCQDNGVTLQSEFFSSILPLGAAETPNISLTAARVKARVAAINSLIKSPLIRDQFLASGGMSHLLEVLLHEELEWAGAHRQIGQLVLDNFLDESMGATLGLWPKGKAIGRLECRQPDSMTADGCWDYQVGRIAGRNEHDKDHWSRDLFDRLAAQRKAEKENPWAKDEL